MRRFVSRTRFHRLAAVVALAALVGCGVAPTGPTEETEVQDPPVLVVAADGSGSFRQAQSYLLEDDSEAGGASLRVTKDVDGSTGGWLKCGRFILAVKAGAFDGVGTITMSMPDSTAMVVDLEITPEHLNDFRAPVVLAANTTGVDVPPDSLSIYWLDETTKAWVDMTLERTMDGANQCVQEVGGTEATTETPPSDGLWTTLQHFSTYSAGKAGW